MDTINTIMKSPFCNSTAIFIVYDGSDGWYDHVPAPLVSPSAEAADALTGPGSCGTPAAGAYPDRCGYGPRVPLLAISPFAKPNFVDHTTTDLTSVLLFIEDNWNLGRIGNQSMDALAGSVLNMFDFSHPDDSRLILDDKTGEFIVATSKDQCMNNGWSDVRRADGTPFKNEGNCIQYVNTGK